MLTLSLSIVGPPYDAEVPIQILKIYRSFELRTIPSLAHVPAVVLPQPCPLPEDHHRKDTSGHPDGDFAHPEYSELYTPTTPALAEIASLLSSEGGGRSLVKRGKTTPRRS